MKHFLLLVVSLGVFGSQVAEAARGANLIRGGLGFLFADHNSFNNPGQFAVSHAAAFETIYSRQDGTGHQSVTPSMVYGNGAFGLGAFVTRAGTDLADSMATTDLVGVGAGFSLLKERLTLGASFLRYLDSGIAMDGIISGTVTFAAPQRQGPAVGFGFTTTMNALGGDTRALKGAIGYSLRSNRNFEATFTLNNLNNTSDWSAGGFVTMSGATAYLGAGYEFENLAEDHSVAIRAGLILGSYVDLSLQGSQVLESGRNATYSASLRTSF